MLISKTFTVHGSHQLENVPVCRNLHGHSYKITLFLEGVIKADGMVMDYTDLKKEWKKWTTEKFPQKEGDPANDDHVFWNDLLNPSTAENLAEWIYKEFKSRLPELSAVEVKETENSSAYYTTDK